MNYLTRIIIVFFFLLTGCASPALKLPGGLTLEEHPLKIAPTSDPYHFQPVEGTQDEILAQHKDERKKVIPTPIFIEEGNPALKASWRDGELIALVFTDAGNGTEQIVKVISREENIFETSAGMPSPGMPLQGLWTYDNHWALEILYADPYTWTGQIFIDGMLINQEKGYEEAFGFQILSDKPFYFYQHDGYIGISYNGQETDLGYTSIPHYLCCSDSILNPIPAENMIAFFAQKEETWYYVEVGMFH